MSAPLYGIGWRPDPKIKHRVPWSRYIYYSANGNSVHKFFFAKISVNIGHINMGSSGDFTSVSLCVKLYHDMMRGYWNIGTKFSAQSIHLNCSWQLLTVDSLKTITILIFSFQAVRHSKQCALPLCKNAAQRTQKRCISSNGDDEYCRTRDALLLSCVLHLTNSFAYIQRVY